MEDEILKDTKIKVQRRENQNQKIGKNNYNLWINTYRYLLQYLN